MTTTPQKATKPPPPGRQAKRSESTQRKIVESALRLIQREGFQRASLQNIARGAKVTLGAVQHHFEARQALMERIVDEALAPLSECGAVWPPEGLSLEPRAREFVSRAWETTYGPPGYLAAWSLFFGCKSSAALFKRIDAKRAAEDPVFFARFLDHFPEIAANYNNPEHFAGFVFATLRGIALLRLFKVAKETTDGQLEVLAELIVKAGACPDQLR